MEGVVEKEGLEDDEAVALVLAVAVAVESEVYAEEVVAAKEVKKEELPALGLTFAPAAELNFLHLFELGTSFKAICRSILRLNSGSEISIVIV